MRRFGLRSPREKHISVEKIAVRRGVKVLKQALFEWEVKGSTEKVEELGGKLRPTYLLLEDLILACEGNFYYARQAISEFYSEAKTEYKDPEFRKILLSFVRSLHGKLRYKTLKTALRDLEKKGEGLYLGSTDIVSLSKAVSDHLKSKERKEMYSYTFLLNLVSGLKEQEEERIQAKLGKRFGKERLLRFASSLVKRNPSFSNSFSQLAKRSVLLLLSLGGSLGLRSSSFLPVSTLETSAHYEASLSYLPWVQKALSDGGVVESDSKEQKSLKEQKEAERLRKEKVYQNRSWEHIEKKNKKEDIAKIKRKPQNEEEVSVALSIKESSEKREMIWQILFNPQIKTILELPPFYKPESLVDIRPYLENLGVVYYRGELKSEEGFLLRAECVPYLRGFIKELREKGYKVVIVYAYRSYDLQKLLYEKNPHGAARPGRSQHQTGFAIDMYILDSQGRVVNESPEVKGIGERWGVVRLLAWDIPHFTIVGPLGIDLPRFFEMESSYRRQKENYPIQKLYPYWGYAKINEIIATLAKSSLLETAQKESTKPG